MMPAHRLAQHSMDVVFKLEAQQLGRALGHRYLSDEDLESVLEGLMSTSLGQRLIERGREQGLVQGREQGLRESIVRVLTRRFGAAPTPVTARLARVSDLQRLDALLDSALAAASLEEFTQALD
jgi:hypothetical protein